MALTYGFLKCKVASDPALKATRRPHETQYHLHVTLAFGDGEDAQQWDCAVNVGTSDADDLLQYRLVMDFHHAVLTQLRAAQPGFSNLTGTAALPALDFLRSDVLAETGPWRLSDVMDGSSDAEPAATLSRTLQRARSSGADVYVFGREYVEGNGIHDVHLNQGSQGAEFLNAGDDHNDHNDVWQDGAVIADLGDGTVAGYFTAFMQQLVPTDGLGNPSASAQPIGNVSTPNGSS